MIFRVETLYFRLIAYRLSPRFTVISLEDREATSIRSAAVAGDNRETIASNYYKNYKVKTPFPHNLPDYLIRI